MSRSPFKSKNYTHKKRVDGVSPPTLKEEDCYDRNNLNTFSKKQP